MLQELVSQFFQIYVLIYLFIYLFKGNNRTLEKGVKFV